MRTFLSIAAAVAVVGLLFAQGGAPSQPAPQGEMKIINLKSDVSGPVSPGDSVIFLVGNFAAQHNGAVITCDSAVRYSDMRIEFFGNVLINKNTTYIYGDRALYDGEVNEAQVFSDIIKVVDGDATLYTYSFLFNTLDNVGEFDGGGVLVNRENQLEAERGYYYADTKELVCVDRVEMRNDEYELRGDSVVYNMATDNAYFFDRTHIWNREGDYLYADRGRYEQADTLYAVTRNGYILTEKQEVWSDSIDYYRPHGHAILRHDIQLDDTEHKNLAFGDYGEYWKEPGNAFLTRRPALVNYDLSQGDSLFMRSDSIYLFTRTLSQDAADAAAAAERARLDSLAALQQAAAAADSMRAARQGSVKRRTEAPDSLSTAPGRGGSRRERAAAQVEEQLGALRDSTAAAPAAEVTAASETAPDAPAAGNKAPASDSLVAAPGADSLTVDSLVTDSLAADSVQLTPEQLKAQRKEEARKEREARKAAADEAKQKILDEIAARRKAKRVEMVRAQEEKERERLLARREKVEKKLRERVERAARKGRTPRLDSTELLHLDSLLGIFEKSVDSTGGRGADSLLVDSLPHGREEGLPADSLASEGADSVAVEVDSMYRLVKAFHNVKIYRTDFQSVCDSLTSISRDSTIHLYLSPVLWNENNQVVSDVMDVYTANRQLTRAEFIGSPMMSSELDTLHYNQVAGKEMTAFFRDNQIYRNDVNGNAQTIYYMQDGEGGEITGVMVLDSGNISFFFEEKQVVNIIYRINPVWTLYPLDKVPEEQSLELKGFKWEGARRPTQRDVFDRHIRPSRRAACGELPKPDFPIHRALEEHKRRLIEERRWIDRNDHVDSETVEWMRTLGYEVGQPRESGPRL